MEFGTAATRRLLDKLSAPDDKLKIVHISGSNGKGSVAAYISAMLVAAGKRTGTFTSPETDNFFSQFLIDGKPIAEKRLEKYFELAYAAADGKATSFEVQTAAALSAFAGEGCEYCVLECGLGGLLDATNAVNSKRLALIASITAEHTSVLGNTIEQICAHKAGIIKNCPAVASALQPDEALKYFSEQNIRIADGRLEIKGLSPLGVEFSYSGVDYKTSIAGSVQAYNAALAIEGARLLGLPENAIRIGISNAKIAGRLQYFESRGNKYIVDGGHNPAAVKPLAELLKNYPANQVTLVYGCLSDKDINGVLSVLAECADNITAVEPASPRALTEDKIIDACRKYFKNVSAAANVSKALEDLHGVIAVCGSFTLVKEAIEWIEKE